MRVTVIVNPVSGGGGHRASTGQRRMEVVRRVLASRGVDAVVAMTSAPGHAAELARAAVASGHERVIVWGGDGTINEAAGPLMDSATPLGLVRGGSGDGLAGCLGVPTDPEAAIAAALDGGVAAIDAGVLGGRHFLNVGGVGFDAAVAAAFNRGRRRGTVSYLLTVATLVWAYPCERYRVQADGQFSDAGRFAVAFANGSQYGNGLVLSADADPGDGWLDAVFVDAGRPLQQLWRMRRLAIGVRRPAAGITRLRVREATVEGERLLCHVDGEAFEVNGAVDVGIRPGALRVCGRPFPVFTASR